MNKMIIKMSSSLIESCGKAIYHGMKSVSQKITRIMNKSQAILTL